MNRYLILFLLPVILLTGCHETQSSNAKKCYEYWTGEKPPKDVKPVRAQYWQSAHWSKEYTIYIELAASVDWKEQFIKLNKLVPSKDMELPSDAPAWFKLGKQYKVWKHPGDDISAYFEDANTGHFFVYEQQL